MLLVAVVAAAWFVRRDSRAVYFTGFVEGEERVIRSEVVGRVLEVAFAGVAVPLNSVVARLDEGDIAAKITAKQRELDMTKADIETQSRRIGLVESTWKTGVDARRAEVAQAESALTLAERTFSARGGAGEDRRQHGPAGGRGALAPRPGRAALARAKDLLSQAAAEGERRRQSGQLEMLRQRAALTEAQIAELEVTRAKYQIARRAFPTVVQTQFVWPGELAQPGSLVVAVLDPEDKYVQVYLPVASMGHVRVSSRVELELDSTPGRHSRRDQLHRRPGKLHAEKIETRGDRVGQVYRAKIRVLQDAALPSSPAPRATSTLLADAGSHGGDEPRAASR